MSGVSMRQPLATAQTVAGKWQSGTRRAATTRKCHPGTDTRSTACKSLMVHNVRRLVSHRATWGGDLVAARVAARRRSVPVTEELEEEMKARPEAFGFDRKSSESSRLARMLEVGARTLKEEVRRAERIELYRAWADDPERRQVAQSTRRMAKEDGLL